MTPADARTATHATGLGPIRDGRGVERRRGTAALAADVEHWHAVAMPRNQRVCVCVCVFRAIVSERKRVYRVV